MNPTLQAWLHPCQQRIQAVLETVFEAQGSHRHPSLQRLQQAMHYSLLQGGKRLRPTLLYASVYACTGHEASPASDYPAAAIELIHSYSLVHDDLPAMDDDDLRRGQPSCHRAFDEATAILAGDALQTLAFDLLAHAPELDADTRLDLIRQLSRASGLAGMCGGQAIDLQLVAQRPALDELELMHRLKTGALIEAAVGMGARIAAANPDQTQALQTYARALGLAFQVQDDILDVTGDTATLGKIAGADNARQKPTYPALIGLDGAQALARELESEAMAALNAFGPAAEPLRQLMHWVVQRPY